MSDMLSGDIFDDFCCIKKKISRQTGQNMLFHGWPWQSSSNMGCPQRRKEQLFPAVSKILSMSRSFWVTCHKSPKGSICTFDWKLTLRFVTKTFPLLMKCPDKVEQSHLQCVSSDPPQVISQLIHAMYCLLLSEKNEHDNQFNWANIDFFLLWLQEISEMLNEYGQICNNTNSSWKWN